VREVAPERQEQQHLRRHRDDADEQDLARDAARAAAGGDGLEPIAETGRFAGAPTYAPVFGPGRGRFHLSSFVVWGPERPAGAPAARWLTGGLLAIMMLAAWGPGLRWGLWLDETFTAWQVDAGWRAIASSKLGNPGQSALFAYLEAPFYFPHARFMELALRIPALAGALLSCFFLHRLGEMLAGRGGGLLAVIAFIGSPELIRYGVEARPYTLALGACLASLWGLLRWLETRAWRDGLLFSVALALVVHLHFTYALFLPVLGFALGQRARRGPPVAWRALAAWLGLAVLLLLPLFPLAHVFLRRSAGLSDVSRSPLPGWSLMLAVLTPRQLLFALVALVVVLVATRRQAREVPRRPGAGPTIQLLLFWLLMPPLALAAVSYLVGQSVVVGRYFFYTVPAQCLLIALLFRDFPPLLARAALLACFLPLPLLNVLQTWRVPDGPDSWRVPTRAIETNDPTGAAPVLLQSGHPMSNASDWRRGISSHSFLYSQLSPYPLANRVYPLPYGLDDGVRSYVRGLADGELGRAPLVFFAGISGLPIEKWVRAFFTSRGYTCRDTVREGLVLLALRRSP
jgi:hypothetical protein